MIRFNDGVKINTDGPLRIKELKDGLYVIGEGMLIPVDDEQEAIETLKEMKDELYD